MTDKRPTEKDLADIRDDLRYDLENGEEEEDVKRDVENMLTLDDKQLAEMIEQGSAVDPDTGNASIWGMLEEVRKIRDSED